MTRGLNDPQRPQEPRRGAPPGRDTEKNKLQKNKHSNNLYSIAPGVTPLPSFPARLCRQVSMQRQVMTASLQQVQVDEEQGAGIVEGVDDDGGEE